MANTSSTGSGPRTRRQRRGRQPSQAQAMLLLLTTAVAAATAAAAASAPLQHSCAAFVPASSAVQVRAPRAARSNSAAPATGMRLYVAGGAGNGGAGGNEDKKKEELYYQRFLGMNEGEPTDEVRLAAEIADMDPSTIDSLRRGTPAEPPMQPPKPPTNPFYGSAGDMDAAGAPAPSSSSSPQQPPQAPQTQAPASSPFGGPASIGGAAGGFLSSVKKAASGASVGSGSSFVPLVNGGVSGNDDMLMSGPRAYVIPQDDRETPLEIRSVPTPRRSQKGVIAEVPGRRLPKRPGRVDLGEKMAEVKRSLKEAPTRLTEMQVQNLRNNMGPGGNTATATPPAPNGKQPPQGANKDGAPFTFPSFPVQLPSAQPPQQGGNAQQSPFAGSGGSSASGGRQRGLKRRGAWGTTGTGGRPSQKSSLPAWSRDWRVWIGAIAGVSFLGALLNSLGSRSELIVMNGQGTASGVADFLLQNAADLGDVEKFFV